MPRKNNRKPSDPDVTERRRHQWKHNSFFGHARMMISQCEAIIHSESTTPATKHEARLISEHARQMMLHLKKRVDPQ